MAWAILDSSIYIDHWERGLPDESLTSLSRRFVIRHSSVVLSELRRGARTPEARRLVDALFRLARTRWTPTEADWWQAGLVLRRLSDRQHWEAHKRATMQNDTLIALTARRFGATVVTTNLEDFNALAVHIPITVLAP